MNLTFIHFSEFVSEWKRFRLCDEDLQALEAMLQKTPEKDNIIAGGGGIRKVRFVPPSRRVGKSGAFRVVYLYLRMGDVIVLLTIFAKKDQENLTDAQKAYLKKVTEGLKR